MSKTLEVKKPHELIKKDGYVSIYIGGSFEHNNTLDFQKTITDNVTHMPYIFYNPREGSENNIDDNFEWEINALNEADVIIMFINRETENLTTLLEIGLYGNSKKMIVCCPDNISYKKDITLFCNRFKIKEYNSLDGIIDLLLHGEIDELLII